MALDLALRTPRLYASAPNELSFLVMVLAYVYFSANERAGRATGGPASGAIFSLPAGDFGVC